MDQQRAVRLELQKIDYRAPYGFFGALCRITATIKTAKDEYRRFIKTTAHTEAMVYELLNEAEVGLGHRRVAQARHEATPFGGPGAPHLRYPNTRSP